MELLEYIHTRYDHRRLDAPERAVELTAIEKKLTSGENGNRILRAPVELERRFLEILYVIIEDSWELPTEGQWIELLDFLQGF